jgi:glycosyltransferase involved in cell wall biosynthesis
MFQQAAFFRQLNNLVFLEYDACQNYAKVKNNGKFAKLYRAVPWARIIVSGHMLARRLRADGFDAVFVPKGFDDAQLKDLQRVRSIELGFIGSTNNSIYALRVKHLQQIAKREQLVLVRTSTAAEYLEKLNNIKFFVSADLGFSEYMLKNFEAMACGCVVFAYNHGAEESAALGLLDMENIVLYNDLEEFSKKLRLLRETPALVQTIAENGKKLVEAHNAFSKLGPKIVAVMKPPLRKRSAFVGADSIFGGMFRRIFQW